MRQLFKGGNYSRAETIRGNTVYKILRNTVDVTDLIARLQMMLEVEFAQYLSIFFCHKRIKEEFRGIIFAKSLWLFLCI